MAMYGSGWRTVGMKIIKEHLQMVRHGFQARVRGVFCAGAVGTLIRTTCVRLTVTGIFQRSTNTTPLAFVSPRTNFSFYLLMLRIDTQKLSFPRRRESRLRVYAILPALSLKKQAIHTYCLFGEAYAKRTA